MALIRPLSGRGARSTTRYGPHGRPTPMHRAQRIRASGRPPTSRSPPKTSEAPNPCTACTRTADPVVRRGARAAEARSLCIRCMAAAARPFPATSAGPAPAVDPAPGPVPSSNRRRTIVRGVVPRRTGDCAGTRRDGVERRRLQRRRRVRGPTRVGTRLTFTARLPHLRDGSHSRRSHWACSTAEIDATLPSR